MLSAFPPRGSGYGLCYVPERNRKHLETHLANDQERLRECDEELSQTFRIGASDSVGYHAGSGDWSLVYCLSRRPRTRLSTSFAAHQFPSPRRTLRQLCSLGPCGVPTSRPCSSCSVVSLPLRSLQTQSGLRVFGIILLLICTDSWPAWQVSRKPWVPVLSLVLHWQ